MILTCPSCETQYFADDATIGDSGRSVKCAACGQSWHVHGTGGIVEDVPAAVAGGAHEAYRERVRERRQRKSRLAATMAWLVTATTFTAFGAALVIFRNEVVRVWPESAMAYRAAGLEVNRFGLDFGPVNAERTFDGTMPVLTISGQVRNVSRVAQPGSDVKISLRDEVGLEVASVISPLSERTIAAGTAARFVSRLENPPVEAFELQLSFVEPDGGFSPAQGAGRVEAAPNGADQQSGGGFAEEEATQ